MNLLSLTNLLCVYGPPKVRDSQGRKPMRESLFHRSTKPSVNPFRFRTETGKIRFTYVVNNGVMPRVTESTKYTFSLSQKKYTYLTRLCTLCVITERVPLRMSPRRNDNDGNKNDNYSLMTRQNDDRNELYFSSFLF